LSTATIERIYSPQKVKQTQMLEGSAREAAAKLIEKLRFEVRVL
jgi:electron transfer flavoprotein beta subunit